MLVKPFIHNVRIAEEKGKERQLKEQQENKRTKKIATSICETTSSSGRMAPWQLEVRKDTS